VKEDTDDHPLKVMLHEHRIGRLEESDEHQWGKIRDHSDFFKELHITMKLLKMGVAFLSFVAFGVAIWLRGGFEALAGFIFGR
jgi:hypothetical protein